MSPSRRGAAAFLLASVLAFAFVYAATVRRLHFDEALVVRSGWLLTGRIPASPPFCMPFTLAAGFAARSIGDPGTLFLVLRLATAGCVLAALGWALRRASGAAAPAATALVVTLLQYAFVAHGLEFRYDAAILVGLLIAFGLLVRGADSDFAPLGVCAALVASHHVKGLLMGGAVFAFALIRAAGERRQLARLAAGVAAGVAAWGAFLAAFGLLPEAVSVYTSFTRLGVGLSVRLWPWESSLRGAFLRDLAFWLAALAAGARTAVLVVRAPRAARAARPDAWALAFLAVTLGFTFVHPQPWPYMLALPAPFAAFLAVTRGAEIPAGAPRLAAAALLAGAVLFQTFQVRNAVGAAYGASFAAPRADEVETLRLLKRLARPDENVLDPSGIAYFQPPCLPEWYLDSLFREGARKGTWMRGLETLDPATCPWVLFTYRLQMLPFRAKAHLAEGWERGAGGLALPRGDPRALLPEFRSRRDAEIQTFW